MQPRCWKSAVTMWIGHGVSAYGLPSRACLCYVSSAMHAVGTSTCRRLAKAPRKPLIRFCTRCRNWVMSDIGLIFPFMAGVSHAFYRKTRPRSITPLSQPAWPSVARYWQHRCRSRRNELEPVEAGLPQTPSRRRLQNWNASCLTLVRWPWRGASPMVAFLKLGMKLCHPSSVRFSLGTACGAVNGGCLSEFPTLVRPAGRRGRAKAA